MKKAAFFNTLKDNTVKCFLCNHMCVIPEGKRGKCGVRENNGGILESLVYGRLAATSADPIEKKPLFHFLPGSISYSISTVGCNFKCLHCQNFHISQYPHMHNGDIVGETYRPSDVIGAATLSSCKSISYTYVEPTVFFEFAYDCAVLAKQHDIKNIFVSNGYMSKEAAIELSKVIDAINIDIKSFSDSFYREICGAHLKPVLDNVERLYNRGVWVEITTLIIPGLNDSKKELTEIANFIKGIDPDIPWHITGFYPCFQLNNISPTPVSTLDMARQIGLDIGLNYVYQGNRPGHGGEDTICPYCNRTLIKRTGFNIITNNMDSTGTCPFCGKPISGRWK